MTVYTSPVPVPAADAGAPEIYRGIYGMPAFLSVFTSDLAASLTFWTTGLGFVELFTIPGRLIHLRRWAFQDVLLAPAERAPEPGGPTMAFACVLGQLDEIAARCEALLPGSTSGPQEQPWNSVDLAVRTPEHVRIVMTAARPLDPRSAAAERLRGWGLEVPDR